MQNPDIDETVWLTGLMLDHIPLARAMDLQISRLTPQDIELRAPLAPNSNDKGCGFGGSIGALLTLSGWGLLSARVRSAGLKAEIYIQDSTLKYLKPAWSALHASASLDAESLAHFVESYRSKGRARIEMSSELYSDGIRAATMQARYVALASH